MEMLFRVYRYDPAVDAEARYQEYSVAVDPTDKILDCLNRIRWEHDPSLSFRMSCAHGVCGSDGMRINNVCALACQRLVRDYGNGPITIDPLPHFTVVKDLIVDLGPFFDAYRSVRPYLIAGGNEPDRERLQNPADRDVFDEAIRCVLCACCTASCPVSGDNSRFIGPAALLRAFRYLFDSRDEAPEERMTILDTPDGVWGCKSHGKCTEVCPKEIDVRKCIGRSKKRLYDAKKARDRQL